MTRTDAGRHAEAHELDHLLTDLTEPQRRAVTTTEGPLLVLAAAGSGKTRVITRRIAYLVRCGVPAWSILALTFTNRAAGEMRERVLAMLNPTGDTEGPAARRVRGLTVTTFHALCARLLRRYAETARTEGVELGIGPDFTIYDAADQNALVKKVIASINLSTTNWSPAAMLAAIGRAKNRLQTADAFAAEAGDFAAKTTAKVYKAYEKALRAANAVDFDDLLLLTAIMLTRSKAVREDCRARWQYLLIDEYQDTNHAQFVIASLLAGGSDGGARPNVCVVGDPDQSIYSWRGADITNILEFEEHYPDAAVIMLGENFRSTAPILGAADSVIRRNRMRKPKDLFTSRPGGEPVTVAFCEDEHDEANLVVDWFRRLREEGLAWRDMAVLYRTNALSRVLEDTLRAAAAPYVVARGTAFYQREEVKHSLAYLRVVANPADDVSLSRIVNVPTRGIGGATLAAVEAQAARAGISLIDAIRRSDSIPGLSTRANAALRRFVATLDGWTGGGTFLGQTVAGSLSELVERVIKESGLEAMYVKQAESGTETDRERLDNLAEVVSSAADFEADYDPEADPTTFPGPQAATDGEKASAPPLLALLRAYLERVSLVADADAVDPAQGAVTLMTLHAAKGLEYPAIAIIGLEEGCLPHARAWESESDLEEERRLFFVGMTRAMRRLQITSARTRTLRGRTERTIPSRFLDEIDTAHIRVVELAEAHEHDDNLDHDPPTHHPASTASTSRGRLAQAKEAFPPGCRVRHPQFGVGTVLSLDGGTSVRVRVRFGQVGDKTLILEYARLQRLS
ncbi:MAG TPA: UvrD-helicase domain-containing protein [Phycisphaerales bacterium]|nr:UvrD-helicase domain-containing protein [Phycisphaerales bacterium]